MKIKAYRLRESARLPSRAHNTDAGMDVYFAPEKPGLVKVPSGSTVVLETGIKLEVPKGHMIQIMNRSSVASKRQLLVGACVIDCGYDGEIFINLHNVGPEPQVIEPGAKIAQAVCLPVAFPSIEELDVDSVYGSTTARGTGGFGSTGDGV